MTELLTLAYRVQALTSACRETDILIGYAVDLRGDDTHLTFRRSFDVCGMKQMLQMAESHQNIWRHELPRYTASLDAAMTLARNNREAMLMIHAAFGSFASDEMDAALNLFPRIKAMLLTNLRARAASESSHG